MDIHRARPFVPLAVRFHPCAAPAKSGSSRDSPGEREPDLLERFSNTAAEAWARAQDAAARVLTPAVRLGVTGLSRSGKTVFITSLVHNILAGNALPFFEPLAQGRIVRAYLEPQPDDAVPRFDYEGNLEKLTAAEPHWPESTRQISELRLTIEYSRRLRSGGRWARPRCISTSSITPANGSSICRCSI